MNVIESKFAVAETLLTGLLERQTPLSVIVSGSAGLGKSNMLRKLCRRYGIPWSPVRPSAKKLIEHLSDYEADLAKRRKSRQMFKQHEARTKQIAVLPGKMPCR